MDTVTLGFMASLLAGLGTGLGILPVLFSVNFTERFQGILLGLGEGALLFVIMMVIDIALAG